MPGKIGASTICTSIIPNFKELDRIYPRKLSKEAKQRLRVLEFYYKKANQNISLTARHFSVSRNYIYKWLKRYNRWNLQIPPLKAYINMLNLDIEKSNMLWTHTRY